MAVPVKNIYYLLCYAWDRAAARDLVDTNAILGRRAENLLAKVLSVGVARLLRGGLDRGYVEHEEEERRLRGKLLLTNTLSRCLLRSGRAVCLVDELSHDVLHNRLLKAAMRSLLGLATLDSTLRGPLHAHCRRMETVADVPLSVAQFRRVQLHRNVAGYAFLLQIAELVARCFLPDQSTGERRFHPFVASPQEMGALFEAFVRNFLRLEQRHFDVARPKIPWDLDHAASSEPAWLPEMRTDIVLEDSTSRVVVDTKYYATPFQSHHGSTTLISDHLYQLLTYVDQLAATDGPPPSGLLLYASSGERQHLRYRIGGHDIRVRSLDLDRDWQEIEAELLGLVDELRGEPAGHAVRA